jgi:cytochrome P450
MTNDLATFNPFDSDTLQCPFPHYAQMREEQPVMQIEGLGMYLVTRHDLVMQILRDPATYSSMFGGASMPLSSEARAKMAEVMAEGYPRVPTMLTADMPDHTRYRRLVSKAFTPKVIAELEPVIRAITTKLIDSWIDDPSIEFVTQFGVPLPVEVIAHALNVPESRMADFKRWSDDSIAGIGTDISLEQRLEAEHGVNEYQHYFAGEFERRMTEPQDDLLTALLQARIDDDDPEVTDKRPLDMAEMLSIVQQLLVAGNETTTKLITNMANRFASEPGLQSTIDADRTLIPSFVEEALRFEAPVQGLYRQAKHEVTIDGATIPAGEHVWVVYAAGNRDADKFERPNDFEPSRENAREHLSFGNGEHFCIGAGLARAEAYVAVEAMLDHMSNLRYAARHAPAYEDSFILRGLKTLDLDFDPPA